MATLNENILKVKDTFDDIASAIEEQGVEIGECESPETYAQKIRSIVGTGGGLDPEKLYVEAFEEKGPEPTVTSTVTDDGGVILTFGLRRGEKGDPGQDGQTGADGADGTIFEYIYLQNEGEQPSNPTPDGSLLDNEAYQQDDWHDASFGPDQWMDRAQGVTPSKKYEWQCKRSKINGVWDAFEDPILWAKYGDKGRDGDGVQYIFTTTTELTKPNNPTPSDWETNTDYQNVEGEYVPTVEGQIWTDDSVDVSEEIPYCWFSIRRFRNGKWSAYSIPAIWDEYTPEEPDVIVIEMDPDSVMLYKENLNAETTIRALRGSDIAIIKEITCTCKNSNDTIDYTTNENADGSWTVRFSNLQSTSPIVSVEVSIKLSDTYVRKRTFSIYQTQYDSETISVDFIPDQILIPCPDGVIPDEGFFPIEVPMFMRIGGQDVNIDAISAIDSNFTSFSFSDGVLTLTDIPGGKTNGSIGFNINGGGKNTIGYVNYTRINTKGGIISMYTMSLDANDIVCDTRSDKNEYTVYNGKQGVSGNIIRAKISEYSTEGNKQYSLSDLTKYAVFYANDPQDWFEDKDSTINEYHILTDDGILIGEGGICPDECVSFQLREWIGGEEPWSTNNDSDYKVWQTETITVDIIRNITAYKFVIEPDRVHRDSEDNLITPSNGQIAVGLCKVSSNSETNMESLSSIPTGYDIYYKIDDSDYVKIGGESENIALPYNIDVTSARKGIFLRLVNDKASESDEQVVLSEFVEITSDVPGKAAYVGHLTDYLGVVSCDANGEPKDGQILSTTFKVTNGTVNSITHNYSGDAFLISVNGDTVSFSEFGQSLPETTYVKLTATYTDADGIQGREEAIYTIVKLKIAEATTILDFSNDNVIVPCDNDYQPYITSAEVFVTMMHGDEQLKLTTEASELYQLDSYADEEGYYKLTLNVSKLEFVDNVCNLRLSFVGTDAEGLVYNRKGQIIVTRVPSGESGKVWDLMLSNDSPKFNNDTDLFDDDFIEGWVNVWGKDTLTKASYQELVTAGYYVVCKATEEFENEGSNFQVLSETDFDDKGIFKIYINPQEGTTYVDLDTPSGVTIGLAKKVGDTYEVVQKEQMQASFDGRDFGKFELLLSDSLINKVYTDSTNYSITPNEIKILGVYEHDGLSRTVVNDSTKLHNKHVAGLDVYYSIDYTPDSNLSFNEENFILVEDSGHDGWASNDTINISGVNIKERVDVYLVAHYDNPDVEGNETILQVVDHKPLIINPIKIPSLYHLELSQDEIKVPIDDNGNVDPDFSVIITPYVYSQDDVQNNVTCYYTFGGEGTPEKFELQWNNTPFTATNFSGDNKYVWFYVDLQGGLYKKCKITKEVNPVEMFIDKVVVKREFSDNLVNDTVSIEAKQWNYNTNAWESVSDYKVTMYYKIVGDSNEKTGETISFSDTTKAVFDLHKSDYYGINGIKFILYSSDNVEKGFEEVGVVTDGIDGSSREVIYYQSRVESTPDNPTPEDWETNSLYQTDDYEPTDWSDDFPGVDVVNKYVYVCERKRTRGANSQWGAYSDPHLYTNYVEVEFTDEQKNEITNAAKDLALENIKKSYYTQEQINALRGELEKAIENGDKTATANASSALETANAVNRALSSLEEKLLDGDKLNASVLSETDIYDLSVAALGSDIDSYDGSIHEDSVFAQKVVGLIATFGTVKVDNLDGDTISGRTVQSSDPDAWTLNENGSGHLANGNISWGTDGKVTLGAGVTISWGDIKTTGSAPYATTGDVNAAQATANGAATAAGEAKNLANTAKSTADTAKSTADTAKNDASTAKSNASSALSSAQAAASAAAEAKKYATNEGNIWKTTIGDSWLSTTQVTAQGLTVNAANITGTLKAENIEAGTITAEKINYSGGILSGGSDKNQVNKILIGSKSEFDSSTEKEVLFIVI